MLSNKEFLQKYPLQYSLPLEEAQALREILKKAGENYAFEVIEKLGIESSGLQYYDFEIYGLTTGFADMYAHIGARYSESVLPIWQKRWSIKKDNNEAV